MVGHQCSLNCADSRPGVGAIFAVPLRVHGFVKSAQASAREGLYHIIHDYKNFPSGNIVGDYSGIGACIRFAIWCLDPALRGKPVISLSMCRWFAPCLPFLGAGRIERQRDRLGPVDYSSSHQ